MKVITETTAQPERRRHSAMYSQPAAIESPPILGHSVLGQGPARWPFRP